MGQLTRFLLPRGFALAVHVEMEDLTIGGLVMGVGMETTCHRVGLIQETVEAFEVVLADGSLVRATRTEHPDLFRALAWSHGTLGFLVAVELRVVPVKPYVRLLYQPCHSLAELAELTRRLAEADDAPDFLETLVFSPTRGVVMSGHLAEADSPAARTRINPVNRWYKPWFYKHVESFLTRGPGEEYVPLHQYYHRHTRSIFWAIEDMLPFCHHPLYRFCFGWLGAPTVSFLKLTMTAALRRETVERSVVQDVIVPISGMERAVELFHELFEIYPLLVFPTRIYGHRDGRGFLRPPRAPLPGRDYQMFFDLGVYGVPGPIKRGQPWDATRAVRAMERYTREVGGYQCLYADIFMTRDEFEEMFDHTHYRKMRAQYGADGAFPEVWDKVRAQW
jgi:delta24-sterol reductase